MRIMPAKLRVRAAHVSLLGLCNAGLQPVPASSGACNADCGPLGSNGGQPCNNARACFFSDCTCMASVRSGRCDSNCGPSSSNAGDACFTDGDCFFSGCRCEFAALPPPPPPLALGACVEVIVGPGGPGMRLTFLPPHI